MKVFLSHAPKDAAIAETLVQALARRDVDAWTFDRQVVPGDNWAQKMGQALHAADLIVFLLTPRSMEETDAIRHDIEFALSSKKHRGRVYTLFIGPTAVSAKDVPWILLNLPHRQVASVEEIPEAVSDIVSMLKPQRKITLHA